MDDVSFFWKLTERSVYLAMPFFIGLLATWLLGRIAPFVGLVDKPCDRKAHQGHIPVVGGLAAFVGIAASASWLVPQFQVAVFLILAMVIVTLGVIDDIVDLPAAFRVLVQFGVAIGMAVYAGLEINNLGNVLGTGPIIISGYAALFFTAVCTIGVINSINMIDGVDGLAGTILGISFSGMAILAWDNAALVESKLLAIFVGAITAFLVFNSRIFFSRARVFLGDSGSMLLGLILVWFLIRMSQGEGASMSPVVAGWIFGLPLIDTISVMAKRILAGTSPFKAGRDHLHHRLLDSGVSVNRTVLIEATIHAVFVTVGIIGNDFPQYEAVMFWMFVSFVLFRFFATASILRWIKSPTDA